MGEMAREYVDDSHHLFIYTRETHPGLARGLYERFTSFEEKMQRARILQERHHTPRKVLVDNLDGDVHRQYAGVPNQSWVIDHTGHTAYKASWTLAPDIRPALEMALQTRELKRQGKGVSLYYRELFSYRISNRTAADSERLAREGR